MDYFVGKELEFLWNGFKDTERVKVVALRKGGCALLSNGWLVDKDGYAEGTSRVPGGRVSELRVAQYVAPGASTAHASGY